MAEPEAAVTEADEGASPAIWLGLISVAVLSFWAQATVTEER